MTRLQGGLIASVSGCSLFMLAGGCLAQGYSEPTEAEMRGAVERALAQAGGGGGASNEMRVDNPLSSMTVKLDGFEKLSCEKAQGRPGYVCDYTITTSMKYGSNEGTAAGDQHAQAVNTLMTWFSGGRSQGATEQVTSRFVNAQGRWTRLAD